MNATSKQNTGKRQALPPGFFSHFGCPFPIDWAKVFGRVAPLVVEIGFGNGEYLISNAVKNPDKNFIGVEINFDLIKKASRRIDAKNIQNVRLLKIHAAVALDYLFAPKTIEQIYALFPFPWPKKRHVRHRLFTTKFLKLANSRLVDKGTLLIVTDDKPFFNWTLTQNRATGFSAKSEIVPPKFCTRFERIWQEEGQKKFFQVLFTKIKHARVSPKNECAALPTVIPKFDPQTFSPRSVTGARSIIFKRFLFDEKKKKGNQMVITAEENLTQRFLILIERTGKGWQARLNPFDRIIKTDLVEESLERMTAGRRASRA